MEVREISSIDELQEFRDSWWELYQKCPWATPFQSPAWLLPWWQNLGSGELLVISVLHQKKMIGMAPLCIQKNDRSQFEVLFLGTGVSDYLDFVCEPDSAPLIMSRLLEHLWSIRNRWDCCDFQELRLNSPLLSSRSLSNTSITRMSICPVVTLPSSTESFMGSLASKLRRSIRQTEKKLSPFSIKQAGFNEVAQAMDNLFLLHGKRWEDRNQPGVLSRPEIQAFHHAAAAAFAAGGELGLYTLCAQGNVSAVLYGFKKLNRFYAYLSGFDPALEDLSPGALLISSVIMDALRCGVREFDFLRGSEKYKYLWGASDTLNYRLTLTAN